jgi:phosphomannomutase
MPNQDKLLAELSRKRTLGIVNSVKQKQLIQPVVDDHDLSISTVKTGTNATIAEKVAEAIPKDLPRNTMSGQEIAEHHIFKMRTALKAYNDNCHRPSRLVLKFF